MDSLVQDFRSVVRSWARAPGFAAVAALTLALGIGATTAIYTVLEKVALDPLPYPESERLVKLKNVVPGIGEGREWHLAAAQFFYYGGRASTIEEIGAYRLEGMNFEGPGGAVRVRVAAVSASTLHMLGARVVRGRVPGEADDVPGAPTVAVLSEGFWRSELGGDPGVIGRMVRLDDLPVEIVGVMARGVELPGERGAPSGVRADVWTTMGLDPAGPFRNNHVIPMFARLAPGATPEAAQAELDRLKSRLPEAFPNVYNQRFFDRYGFRTVVYPLKDYVVGDVAKNLWILLGAVGLVLLIAAANVANLFMVRVEARRRELAIRAALGASRRALAGHHLAESLALALVGGALALLVAEWGVAGLTSVAPETVPRLDEVRLDGSVVLFTLALSLGVAFALAAVAPMRHGNVHGAAALAEGGRTATVGRERQRIRSTLVASQVALALVLVVGAGLLLESFRRLRAVEPGIEPSGVLKVELFVPSWRYADNAAKWRFFDRVLERVRALPGVGAAGVATEIPFGGGYGCTVQAFEDRAVHDRLGDDILTRCADQLNASRGSFEALGIPLRRGRLLTQADHDDPERASVVVSQAFAERFFPGEDPIGKRIAPYGRSEGPFFTIVGVVGDVYASSVREGPALAVYYPMVPPSGTVSFLDGAVNLLVRTSTASPASLFPAIRRVVDELDPSVPVANAEEMKAVVARSMSHVSFMLVVLGAAAAVALALAAIGLYGVVSYVVTRRTSEIGVRVALGALPRQVERLVVGDSLRLVALGLAAGIVGALLVTRLLRGLLFGVAPTHPAAYAVAASVLVVVAVAASWAPARRAAMVDPVEALRVE